MHAFVRQRDGRTNRQTDTFLVAPRWYSKQRGKNVLIEVTASLWNAAEIVHSHRIIIVVFLYARYIPSFPCSSCIHHRIHVVHLSQEGGQQLQRLQDEEQHLCTCTSLACPLLLLQPISIVLNWSIIYAVHLWRCSPVSTAQ